MHSKSENRIFAIFFPISSEGIKAKLAELASESESFLSKVKIDHFHLPITTYPSCIGDNVKQELPTWKKTLLVSPDSEENC